MKLLNKFLVTGGDSTAPNPRIPHDSIEQAVHAATNMLNNRDFQQDGAIIWIPCKVVRLKNQPVEVLDAKDA